ncbi:hypothetical protein Tco_0759668 [Tanacetum coccineum]
MSSEYQQDYKKTRAYAPKIYNDPNMTEELKDIYRALESRYVHEGRTIDPSFYRDLSDDSVAKFTNIGFDCLLSLNEKFCPRENIYSAIGNREHTQAIMENHQFDERYKLFPRKMYSLKAKQPKKPPLKRTRNVGKSKRVELTTLSSTESPPSDNGDLPSTSPRSYDSYNALQAKYDELQSEFGDQEAALVAHKLAVKKLESQLKASHKQQSSLTEKLNFQANQIFEKDEKLKSIEE